VKLISLKTERKYITMIEEIGQWKLIIFSGHFGVKNGLYVIIYRGYYVF